MSVIKTIKFNETEWEKLEIMLGDSRSNFSSFVKSRIFSKNSITAISNMHQERLEKLNKENYKLKSGFLREVIFQLRAQGYNLDEAKNAVRNSDSNSAEIRILSQVISETNETLNKLYELLQIINENLALDFETEKIKIADDENVKRGEAIRQERKELGIKSTIKQDLAKSF